MFRSLPLPDTDTLAIQLFGSRADRTTGTRLHFRVLELFFIGYAVYFCWIWGLYIQQNVSSLPFPRGLAYYVDVSFLFEHHLALANAALVGVLGLLGFARVSRVAYLAAVLAFHLQYVARFCLGKVEHGSNLIGMGILALGIALLAYRSEANRRRFTFGFLYFFVGLSYTSAAFCKLIGTGLTWPDGHHLELWIAERRIDLLSTIGAFDPTIIQELVLRDHRVGTVILLMGLITELCAVLLWWRRYRPWIAVALIGMHVGIIVTMNIYFLASMYLLVLVCLPWHRTIDWTRHWGKSIGRSRTRPA